MVSSSYLEYRSSGDTGGTEYSMDLTYPSYEKVEELIEGNFDLSSENSEMNYECMKNIFRLKIILQTVTIRCKIA